MNNIASEVEQLKAGQATLLRAVRISLSLILVTLTAVCVRAAVSIPTWRGIFGDMLPGKPLPLITELVIGHAGGLVLFAVLIAVVGVALLIFSKAHGRGVVSATIVVVLLFAEWQIITSALQLPLTHLLSEIAG